MELTSNNSCSSHFFNEAYPRMPNQSPERHGLCLQAFQCGTGLVGRILGPFLLAQALMSSMALGATSISTNGSPSQGSTWGTAVVAGLAVLSLTLGVVLLSRWRRDRSRHDGLAARERAQESLRESEARFRGLFEHAHDALVVLKGPEWGFVSANPACLRMFGVSDQRSMLAQTPWGLSPERQPNGRPSAEMALEMIAKAMAEGANSFEWTHRRVNGEEFFADVLLVRMGQQGDHALHATVRDVTDRRRAEEQARRWQRVFESADFMLAHTDAQTNRFIEVNAASARAWGYEREELIGQPISTIYPPEALAALRERFQTANESGHLVFESLHRRKDGTCFPVMVDVTTIKDASGQAVSRVAYAQDISERKRAEEALAAEATRRRILIDGSRDGIVVLNQDGGVFEANRRFAEMLGYGPEEVRRLNVWNWDRDWPPERVLQAIRDLGPEGAHFESRHWRKDGSWFDVELSNSAAELGGQKHVFCVCHDISERKEAARALQARELMFSSVVSQAADAIAIFDVSTSRFVEFNRAAHEGLGYTREEFSHFSVRDIQAEHSPEQIRRNIDHVQDQGEASFETKHRHRDGTFRDARVSLRKLPIPNRDLMSVVWTDITQRKLDETRTARDRLRTEFLLELHQRAPQLTDRELYDHVLERAVQLTDSTIGFFHQVSDDQSTIILTTWNRQALANCTASFDTHYPLKEAGNWVDCVRQQRPVVYNDFAQSPNQHGLPTGHAAVRRFMSIPVIRDGKVRIIFGVGNKADLYNESDVDQLQVVANELHKIMVQRVAQDQLRQSEQRFRHLVETTLDWVWEIDASGRYTFASPKVLDLLGYRPEEVIGLTPYDLMPPEEAERMTPILEGFIESEESFTAVERATMHKNGREVALESSGVPVLDEHGVFAGYRGIDRDVTERRRLESQFRQAQKLEAVGQLAGGVAHDFNNILAAILVQLSLLQMNPALNAETIVALKDLEAEARRAASLTRQLLMFSRRSVLDVRPLNLNDVVNDLLKMLTRLIGEHMRLVFNSQPGALPVVAADTGMLEQVLMNLVVNARDAMPAGGRIMISTTVEELDERSLARNANRRQGRFVTLGVSDTGAGMTAETMERIFEPFFTTKEVGKGTGLGLATVHGIVAQHKGWVEVESELGKGATFRVFLPAHADAGGPVVTASPDKPLQKGRETILIVEDEISLRRNLGRGLRILGYRVHEAENGQQAMELWQQHGMDVDLLLTDMVMPEGITGLELAERLQARKPGLRVIISSGYSAEIAQAGRITQAGIAYLPKPYEMQKLADTVRACLDRKGT